jgi:uncharacterized protein (DUF1330 family)
MTQSGHWLLHCIGEYVSRELLSEGGNIMKTKFAIGLACLIGVGVGAFAVQGIHAQAKPPAYVIAEIEVTQQDGYVKEYLPPSSKALLDNGAKYLARGSRTASIKGEPPKRIVLLTFENFEKAQAAFNSPAFQAAAQIGEKYAKFRIYAVEGAPPQ